MHRALSRTAATAAAAAAAMRQRTIHIAATAARYSNARTSIRGVQRSAASAVIPRNGSRGLSLCAIRRAQPQHSAMQSNAAPAAAANTPVSAASNPAAAATAVPVASSAASPPAAVPLSSLGDLSSFSPRLPKHSAHGYLVYSSPMEKSLRAVKMFSLSSAAMALLSAPVMMILANPAMSLVGRGAIAGTVMIFGVSTTIALTYFTRSYVVRIFAKQDPGRAEKVKIALAAQAAAEAAAKEREEAEAAAASSAGAAESSAPSTPAVTAATATASAAVSALQTEADRLASESWLLTVETLNLWGRPVFRTAPHSSFHPLLSALFNNLRVQLTEAEAKERGMQPVTKDLFIHADLATNPLLVPLWTKATVLSRNLTPIDADELAERHESRKQKQKQQASAASTETDSPSASSAEESMSVEQARRVLEAHHAKRAAAAAAAAKSAQ